MEKQAIIQLKNARNEYRTLVLDQEKNNTNNLSQLLVLNQQINILSAEVKALYRAM